MDWPLSREEKRLQVLQLYDREEQMTDSVLMSGQAAIAKMKAELETMKNKSKVLVESQQGLSEDSQRLWQALEAASAVFRAVVPSSAEDDCSGDEQVGDMRRASSAHVMRSTSDTTQPPPVASKKPRTPRSSLTGKQRRVSFGELPEACKKVDVSPEGKDLSDAEPVEPEPEEALHHRDSPQAQCKIPKASWSSLEWGLTEFCVPAGTPKVGIHFRLPPEPLYVHRVTPGSWAEAQGIREGDVVNAVAGKHAGSLTGEHFVRLMMGRPLRLTIERLPRSS